MKDTHLYLILSPKTRTIKIGISRDPRKRMMALQCASGFPLVIVKTWPMTAKRARFAERRAHEYLAHDRLRGEWFSSNSGIGYIIISQSIMDAKAAVSERA